MTQRIYIDRSRVQEYQHCPRKRWLEYHEAGTGIEATGKGMALAVGGAVHEGLAVLLREGQEFLNTAIVKDDLTKRAEYAWLDIEEHAVAAALADLATQKLELDASEALAMTTVGPDLAAILAESLGLAPDDPQVTSMAERNFQGRSQFDKWLEQEQRALVEGLVRAYARRRLRPLLEKYEVLEVEREGEWKLSEWRVAVNTGLRDRGKFEIGTDEFSSVEIWFMSRPDALLRDRESNQLYIMSFKTTGNWDHRRERDARHDMQGLSEGVEIDLRLGEWWRLLKQRIMPQEGNPPGDAPSQAMYNYLSGLDAPPRVLGIRYEYLLKGERWRDRDLTARLGVESRVQKSHLIRGYMSQAGAKGVVAGEWNWSWDFLKEDGAATNLYWKSWRGTPVWEYMPVREWIDRLEASEPVMSGEDSTMGLAPRLLGYRSPAQVTGYTEKHPLDAVFVTPETCAELLVYRNDDELRDWLEQVEAQERRIAEGTQAVVAAGTDEAARRSALNVHFPQNRRACEYPMTCQFARDKVGVCWAGEEMRRDPIGSGEYKARVPNHPQEGGKG